MEGSELNNKPCPPGKEHNPKTGNCVKEKKKKSVEEKMNEPCPPGKERNPKTGNCVKEKKKKTQKKKPSAKTTKTRKRFDYLYPSYDDPEFHMKIAQRKEFAHTMYDGKIQPVEAHAAVLCDAEFELAPHQSFVRNFVSNRTPYNGLLLYHGMGSGKTCSAISIAEETRMYQRMIGNRQRIIVVASPNVQENFRLQLFDERKLQSIDGFWTMTSCTGDRLLREINPNQSKGLKRSDVIRMVNKLIRSSYSFMGYIEFANHIIKRGKKLPQTFSNRLLIIDEVHNIRLSDDNAEKRVANELERLVKSVEQMKLIFMSGTPMYNSPREITWLINLLNTNDRRPHPPLEVKDVFDGDGFFKLPDGRALLERRATGYISFVRGENPYTFPYRMWAKDIDPQRTFQHYPPPRIQLNGAPVPHPLQFLDVYLTPLAPYQEKGYAHVIANLDLNEDIESFNYTVLQRPLEALNMVYPDERLDTEAAFDSKFLVGKEGLNRLMTYTNVENPPARYGFEYKSDKYGRIFSPDEIGKYSHKIKTICDNVAHSEGVSLIYSQYIDGGLVPVAMALEEMGFTRAGGTKSLLKKPPTNPPVKHKYVMITGEKGLSPDNLADLKLVTNTTNKDGGQVKVVLVSQAGTEGLDFKFIRQVHILEPWYNMNRIEQIIGRAVRTCSHKDLPFSKRNVEIYMHGTVLSDASVEAADLYLYGVAERKALKIGLVSRLLKECSVDCHLNIEQTNFTVERMKQTVTQELATGKQIQYQVGDKPYTSVCDYMDTCVYKCAGAEPIENTETTYHIEHASANVDTITKRVRALFKDRFFYRKKELLREIRRVKNYPLEQIHVALTKMLDEYLIDKFGRSGRLVNIGDLYLFEPTDLTLPNKRTQTDATVYERSTPVDFKRAYVKINVQAPEVVLESDSELVERLRRQFYAVFEPTEDKVENDWYKHAPIAVHKFMEEGVDEAVLKALLVAHIVEEVLGEHMLNFLNGIESANSMDEFAQLVRTYVKERTMVHGDLRVFPFSGTVMFVRGTSGWKPAEFEDLHDVKDNVVSLRAATLANLSHVIGFMLLEKVKKIMVFKNREMDKKSSKGVRCSSIKDTLRVLKRFVPGRLESDGTLTYTNENGKSTKMNKNAACIYIELVLRLLHREKQDKKVWFLSPFEAELAGIK